MPALRNTTVLGFHQPLVKDGEVTLPVFVHGETEGITASPGVWKSILLALAPLVGLHVSDAPPGRARPGFRERLAIERLSAAERAERKVKCRAIWSRFIAEPELTVSECGREVGMTKQAVNYWFKKYAAEPGAPRLKPNGKIA